MKKIYILFLVCSLTSYSQTQIGTDIDGEFANDQSGRSVSLSSDGSILAIGANGNDGNGNNSGHVRVYQNILGVWTQIGTDIDGEAADSRSGVSVSLSSDGNIVAIGGNTNSGNGFESGHVRVYQNISGVWTQIGTDIDGEVAGDWSGINVSLSSDGNIVAIGAPYNPGNGPFYYNSGHVRVYQNVSGVWTKIGSDIDGEAEGDMSGISVSLSSDGNIVAIGARHNDGNGDNSGHVRVYQNVSGVWTQIGSDIDGEAAGDWSGDSVSLSSDGNIVAIGAQGNSGNGDNSGHVRVYQNLLGVWTQIGSDIDGETEYNLSGDSVSLSSDGNILAIGAPSNSENGVNSGQVRVYQNVLGVWTQIGYDIYGEAELDRSGMNISLSSDGSKITIGAQFNAGNGVDSGHLRVYDLSAVLSKDSIVLDNFLIYPNPSNGILNISLDKNLQLEKVTVYNQLGQVVKTAETNIISTTELAEGTYYVEIVTNLGKATKKIMVE